MVVEKQVVPSESMTLETVRERIHWEHREYVADAQWKAVRRLGS